MIFSWYFIIFQIPWFSMIAQIFFKLFPYFPESVGTLQGLHSTCGNPAGSTLNLWEPCRVYTQPVGTLQGLHSTWSWSACFALPPFLILDTYWMVKPHQSNFRIFTAFLKGGGSGPPPPCNFYYSFRTWGLFICVISWLWNSKLKK